MKLVLAFVVGWVVLWFLVQPASSMTHTLRFTSTADPTTIATVGVLSNGQPITSGAMPVADAAGVYSFPTHVQYGHATSIVLIDTAGRTSPASNVRKVEGCAWDRNGDGVVGGPDFGDYLMENGAGTATPSEAASFAAAFGMRCP